MYAKVEVVEGMLTLIKGGSEGITAVVIDEVPDFITAKEEGKLDEIRRVVIGRKEWIICKEG